MSYLY
jgi:hypothetical protein